MSYKHKNTTHAVAKLTNPKQADAEISSSEDKGDATLSSLKKTKTPAQKQSSYAIQQKTQKGRMMLQKKRMPIQ